MLEEETFGRKRLHDHIDAPSAPEQRKRVSGEIGRPRTKLGYSGLADEGVSGTDKISWGRLLPVDTDRWSGIALEDRREGSPASRPQGYIAGRDSECDLVIDHPYVSNRHCLIYRVVQNDAVCAFLRDMSSNGTFVNQTLVGCNKAVELKDEDEITIFESARFQFRLSGPVHRSFAQHYILLDLLEQGHLCKVFAYEEISTGERFAVKKHELWGKRYDQGVKECIAAELNLMGLRHNNIIFMKEAFADDTSSFHVTQIAQKGNLYEMLVRKSKLSEDETWHIFQQLFAAVKYLHDRNIVHRDLKPENILILNEEYGIALCSFGLSVTITTGSFDTTLCGTPTYVAPEVLAGIQFRKYGREVDIWSLGVVLYICLCGFFPFADQRYSKSSPYTLSQQIKSARFNYPSPYWDSVDDLALDLIDKMLVVDPGRRYTIEQCLAHPWVTQLVPGQQLFVKQAPSLRHTPTTIDSRKQMPPSTYIESPKESELLKLRRVVSNAMTSTSKTKDRGKLPPMVQSIKDNGNDLKDSTSDKNPPESQLRIIQEARARLSKALEKANKATQLDNDHDFKGARSTYLEACKLINQIEPTVLVEEDKQKLQVISKSYRTRVAALDDLSDEMERSNETFPQEQSSAATTPQPSPKVSATQLAKSGKNVAHVPKEVSLTRGYTDPVMYLEYDSFAELTNSAINKPRFSGVPSAQLPEDLQIDIEFNDRDQEPSTWTCTPSAHLTPDRISLRKDDHPVVLPVEYHYALMGMFSPPPDPHPRFISPSAPLSDEDTRHILSTFPACVGFYLLINGFLQVIMPEGFDYEAGVPSLPSEFGGLKVSLISETVCPTAGQTSASIPSTTTTSTGRAFERIFGQSTSQGAVAGPAKAHGLAANPPANAVGVSVGCAVRAMVPGSKSKQRFEGKTGVAISPRDDNSKKYITIPTHLLTDAVIASKTTTLESDTWKADVKVCVASNSGELGEVTAIYDQDPKSFPIGFSHDVSLVDISGISENPRTIPYVADLTWLSQQEWMDIKYESSNLVLLDDRSREAKSIGVVDSRCQVVGQGIFRIRQQSRKRSSFLGSLASGASSSHAQDPRDDPSTWTSLVARSLLYPVHPDYPVRGGQSGVPVCVVSENTDGTASRSIKVAGFASFVQMVSDVQKYDLEGDKLYKRLQEGRVAFYGAFQVPEELREGYRIL